MPDLNPEQLAREKIDAMLVAAGWIVQDYKCVDFCVARGIALHEVPLKTSQCDYFLLVDRKAIRVVEAKKQGTTLSTVAEQSSRCLPTSTCHPRPPIHFEKSIHGKTDMNILFSIQNTASMGHSL